MCLTIDRIKMRLDDPYCDSISSRNALIAKRPLIVRKRMQVDRSGEMRTPFQGFIMKNGVLYTEKKPFDIYNNGWGTRAIEGGGFHAILTSATPENCIWLRNKFNGEKLVYGIIPEGTKFFLGADNDIVAKSIILYEKYRDLVAVHGQPVHRSKVRPVIHYTQRAPK